MTSPADAVLVAPGTVTRREWQKEPVEVPLREALDYDRFARELAEALGGTVRVEDAPDPGAGVLFLGAADAAALPQELRGRAMLLEASPNDHVRVVRGGLLGAVPEDALAAWRGGRGESGRLFGSGEVVGRMPGTVSVSGERFGYVIAVDDGRALPALLADYLRTWLARDPS